MSEGCGRAWQHDGCCHRVRTFRFGESEVSGERLRAREMSRRNERMNECCAVEKRREEKRGMPFRDRPSGCELCKGEGQEQTGSGTLSGEGWKEGRKEGREEKGREEKRREEKRREEKRREEKEGKERERRTQRERERMTREEKNRTGEKNRK